MSIIQTIREKGAKISVVLIALALLGFILTDYFAGKGRGATGGGPDNVGSVNGTKINAIEFQKNVDRVEANMRQQGYPQGAALTQQAVEQTWNQEISRVLFSNEFDKLGMRITKKELGDILYGPNAPADLKQQFTDEATGQYNATQAKQQIDQMLKQGTAEQKEQFSVYITQLEHQRMTEKYTSMLANSINFPKWLIEKQNADNSQIAKIAIVRETYASLPDSIVKVTDKEIQDYINKNKDEFKQEDSRSVNYITFTAAPNAKDSADVRDRLLTMKPLLDSTQDITGLMLREGANNFYDGYINGKAIQIAAKDSIFNTPVGQVYGPYLDGPTYVLAKVIGARPIPDSVTVRHILVATSQQDPQTRQLIPTRDTLSAKKLIDSIQTAIRNGSNFDTLVTKLSEDPGSKEKGGVYENVPSGQMTSAFNDFMFLNPVGTKGVVKTEFGYHYMEIMSQKGGGIGYKVAYLPKEIIASQETDNAALNKANQFAADSRDQKSFDENFEKTLKPQGLVKGIGSNIRPNDAQVSGLGASRSFVRNIYEAKKGEVLKPERIDDNYVVAVVTEVLEEGTQSVVTARPSVESALRNKKKAALLKQKIGKVTTLEAASAALGKPIEPIDSIQMSSRNTSALGYEPRVTGAAFNPSNKGKVVTEVLEGQNGVYVLRVDNVSAIPVIQGDVTEQRNAQYMQAKQMVANPQSPSNPLGALRKAATIKDKRADRY